MPSLWTLHRDSHEVEIAHRTETPIATITIPNTSAGYAELLAWVCEHSPGPRLVCSIEGTRSYGAGLARALAAAGLMVTECEQPRRRQDPTRDPALPQAQHHRELYRTLTTTMTLAIT